MAIDVQSQRHHCFVDANIDVSLFVDLLVQGLRQGLNSHGHFFGVSSETARLKRGLNQSALPFPTLSFDDHQAAAIPLCKDSYGTRVANDRSRVCDENFVHILRVKEELKMEGADSRVDQITIVAVQRLVRCEKVVLEFVGKTKFHGPVARAGRKHDES